jgi:AraC-like DNA-binding protein
MPELTVAAGLARGLIELAAAKGADAAALAACVGIDPATLEDHDRRLAFSAYVTLMRAAKAMTGDEALGLHFGEHNDLAQVSIVGLIGEASETVFEAFVQTNRYGRLVVEFDGGPDRFSLEREDGGLWVVDNRLDPNTFFELTESTFARLVSGARRFGQIPVVRAMEFTHPQPAYAAEYARIFNCPLSFGAARNAMLIDEAALAVRVQRQPRYVFGILNQRAEALLKSLAGAVTTRARVEGLLLPNLHTGRVSMDAVAGQLAMSRPTLLRRLKNEGTTFEKVLDDLRRRLAIDYLDGRKVSVNETAYLVGFSDPAAFSRAFKRWTGRRPGGRR